MTTLFKRYFFAIVLFVSCGFTLHSQIEFVEKENLYLIREFNQLKLDSLWEFSSENHSTKADWHLVNTITLKDIKDIPIQWNGEGWFRKSFTLPDSLKNKTLYFQIGTWGASEIYIDSVRVATYGIVSKQAENEKTFLPHEPVSFLPENRTVHHLMVHYSNHRLDLPGVPVNLKGFSLGLSSIDAFSKERYYYNSRFAVSISFCLAFSLFFIFVYWFYPKRFASIMAAVWLIHFSIIFIAVYAMTFSTDGEHNRLITLSWATCVATVNGSVVLFYYALYYGKLTKRAWVVLSIMLILTFLIWTFRGITNFLGPINMLYNIEIFRILYLGFKRDRNKFWILAIGQPLSLLLFMLAIVNAFGVFSKDNASMGQLIVSVLSDLCVPIMLSLQLAWEFGSANRSLQKQLGEVSKLSKENLEQEKEKQQILATQNETLEKQVTERTGALNQSLINLKATQNQLIQSEKLASLGELTAGIAHEIQNPLNFVNNFSELNVDLVKDIKDEMHKPDIDKPYLEDLLKDLTANEKNINHHGKRAASIVSGMLEHSRTSTGKKEWTDINKLADEYFRLSYHGLRAKNKDFNTEMITHFDTTIPKIEIIPQDVGRVILNLINNAFYAVNEKRILDDGQRIIDNGQLTIDNENKELYAPIVTVTTKKLENAIEIRVKDNGTGMSEAVRAKVFQPFFTTKPTGQGTGLGLSLAYDIITKGQDGTLKVESTEGVGSEFIIQVPLRDSSNR